MTMLRGGIVPLSLAKYYYNDSHLNLIKHPLNEVQKKTRYVQK